MMMETFYLPLTRRVGRNRGFSGRNRNAGGAYVGRRTRRARKIRLASKSIGFTLSADAKEKDLGLPIYPGAKEYKEDANSDAGLQMALLGRIVRLQTGGVEAGVIDSPEKIAALLP